MTTTVEQVEREYQKTRRLIGRLYNTHTPLAHIEKLYHDLEIGRENDLERITGSRSA